MEERNKDEISEENKSVEAGSRSVGLSAAEAEMDQVLKDLYLDSQISSPDIERREMTSFMRLIGADDNWRKGTRRPSENTGNSSMDSCKMPERSRKIGLCSNNLLHVQEDEHTKYLKDYQYNTYGILEKKQLSPIVEKKLSLKELQVIDGDKEEPKAESPLATKKTMSHGRFSKQSSKEKAVETERKTSRSSQNIEKMMEELLIRHVPDVNMIRAIDTTEVHRKISNDESQMAGKNTFVSEKLNSPKGFAFPFFTRRFTAKEFVKQSWKSCDTSRRTLSEGASNESSLEIQIEGETVQYDEVSCFWEDVCFTPRTDRKRKERRLQMRRNSSPDVLLNKIKKKISLGKSANKDTKVLSEKKSTPKVEKKEKSGSRQVTPKLSRQSSRETPTPERKRSHTRQAKRSVSNTPKLERKRSTPKLDKKQDETSVKNKCNKSDGVKRMLERTASTPELYRRAFRKQQKDRYRTSSTPTLRRRTCRNTQEANVTPSTERKTSKHQKDKSENQSRRLKGRHGGSVDRYDYQDIEYSPDLFLFSKKSSFSKKKQNSKDADDEVEQLNSGPVDPVYSLLKCAADLPRSGGKSPCPLHAHCSGQHGAGGGYTRYPSGGDSSGNTSKTSSPSSSASHSPKTRRKKLNARMKSFSLDTPEPPKQLLGIDETTKKKSSSFTNTCFGGKESPDDKLSFSASTLRKKFALGRASSLETDDKKRVSYTPSPKESPKSQRKEKPNLYVALYNFKAKEKDDMDLRAGWRVNVTDSSKKDWWKGKSHGKSGYFPATYVIPISYDQRVFQVLQALNLSDGTYAIKFHKDQIVMQVGEEVEGMIMIRAANNRQAMCPLLYLQEL